MNEALLPVAVGLGAVNLLLLAYCFSALGRLRTSFNKAFAGLDNEHNLATTVSDYFEHVKANEKSLKNVQKGYDHLATIATKSLQKTAVVRFNPFRNTGGDQSFVLALLDNHDTGFLLTSIHSREGTRVYVKPVQYGNSEYTLSTEEQEALKQARKSTGVKESS